MVKKILSVASVLAICLLLMCGTATAAGNRVFDYAELFTEAEEQELQRKAEYFIEKYKIDIVILTSLDVPYSSDDNEAERLGMNYADDFYDNNGFGIGSDKSGFLFFLDMSNRMPIISTCGRVIDIVTDARLAELFDTCSGSLSNGYYAYAIIDVLDQLEQFMNQGIPEGHIRYDIDTGEILTSPYLRLEIDEILMAAAGALVVALIFILSVNSKYKLKGSTYSYNTAANSSLRITGSSDDYITSRVTRTPRNTDNGGGGGFSGGFGGGSSGVHTSSGGSSHGGGGGGRF